MELSFERIRNISGEDNLLSLGREDFLGYIPKRVCCVSSIEVRELGQLAT